MSLILESIPSLILISACRLKTSDNNGDDESQLKDSQKSDKDILVSNLDIKTNKTELKLSVLFRMISL